MLAAWCKSSGCFLDFARPTREFYLIGVRIFSGSVGRGGGAPMVVKCTAKGVWPMPKVIQLTVSCENRPGTLSHLARVLGDAKGEHPWFSLHHFRG